MNTTIQRWGNSYAVRLPVMVVRKLKLRAGNEVVISESHTGQSLSLTPVKHRHASLAEMAATITKKNQHTIIDWGGAVGKEVW